MYRPIIGTLGFVLSANRSQTLLVHRVARTQDAHYGKFNGLGGKMITGEDVVTCLKREIHEEAGIICEEVLLRGTINWPGFGPHGEDWLGFIFRIDKFSGTPFLENEEGPLLWQAVNTIEKLPMWEGDRYFLPMVFDNDPRVFHGYMPYENGHLVGWSCNRI
jgi:8-oxo-dGTP diphosphatase